MRAPSLATLLLATPPLAATLLAATLGPARADDWRRMQVAAVGSGGIPADVLGQWSTEMAANEDAGRSNPHLFRGRDGRLPVSIQFATFPDGPRTVVVSIISDHLACDPGVNSATSDDIHVRCAGKVGVAGGATVSVPGACFMEVSRDSTPGVDPARNGSWASFDPATRRARITTVRDGRPLPDCERGVVLP